MKDAEEPILSFRQSQKPASLRRTLVGGKRYSARKRFMKSRIIKAAALFFAGGSNRR
jgi:hypothetical protein